MNKRLIERFLKYVKIDTKSDPISETFPSTMKQKNLGKILLKELQDLNIECHMDEYGYVYGKINSNLDYKVPTIGFISHMDTSSDAPGENVNPRIIKNYDGSNIKLNDKLSMNPHDFPSLNRVINQDIIVTDGNTLLGADDKAGVSEIMEMVTTLTENKDIKHGDIYICFTPDEEVGRGVDYFNYDYFKVDFGYTVDGGEVGEIQYENFNAASCNLTFIGKSIHPGSAKNKLINSLHLAFEFHKMLPYELDPFLTSNYEGFNHITNLEGLVEETKAHYIIRNHDKELFNKQKNDFIKIKDYLNDKYNYECVKLEIKDSYYNMYDIIKDHMDVVNYALKAIKNLDINPIVEPIRGGTDGSRLTYEKFPCPNLGTGGYQFHGRYEFASINQMEKSVLILLEIIKVISSNK